MNRPENYLSTWHAESEELWRQKLAEAYQRYQAATARYRELLAKTAEGEVRYHDDPMGLERNAESEALAEYMLLLKIVTGPPQANAKYDPRPRRAEEVRDGDFNFSS